MKKLYVGVETHVIDFAEMKSILLWIPSSFSIAVKLDRKNVIFPSVIFPSIQKKISNEETKNPLKCSLKSQVSYVRLMILQIF